MRSVREVSIADAIAYTREREALAESEQMATSFPAFHMADCISSGLAGQALADTLARHFPDTPRADVYRAIGLAVAIMQAALTIGEMKLASLQHDGGRA